MARYKLIACQVSEKEFDHVIADSSNEIDVIYLKQELHNTPALLREELKSLVRAIEADTSAHPYDAILLGYGLCSSAIVGVRGSKLPIVVPRAHDCTTLFMGSKERYADYFQKVKGTFFIAEGWLQNGFENGEDLLRRRRNEYMDKYHGDTDTVEMLMQIERELIKNYHALTCIYWPCMEHRHLMEEARRLSEVNGWEYLEVEGSPGLLQAFVNGDWDEDRFLVLRPGETATPAMDESIMKAEA